MSPHLRKTAGRRRPRHGRPPVRPGRHRARPHRDLRRRGARRGAAAGVRPGRRSRRSSRSAPTSCRCCPRVSTTTRGCGCVLDTEVTGIDPRHAGPSARRRQHAVATTRWCWPPARAVRAAGAGPRPAGLLRLPHHRGPRGDPRRPRPAPRVGAVIGGGLLGLEAANALLPARARHPRGRVRAAADAGAGRRGRRRDAAPAHRAARAAPCTPARPPRRCSATTA